MTKKEIAGEDQNKLRRTIRYSVATVAIIALLFLVVEGFKFYRLSPDRLFNENFVPYKLTSPGNTADSSSSKIESAYGEKNFKEVIRLNGISVLSAKDIFLTGLAYLESGEDSRAISSFRVALLDMESEKLREMHETVEYYLAMTYLKNMDFDLAIELMTAIHNNPSHIYRDKFPRSYINKVKKLKWR